TRRRRVARRGSANRRRSARRGGRQGRPARRARRRSASRRIASTSSRVTDSFEDLDLPLVGRGQQLMKRGVVRVARGGGAQLHDRRIDDRQVVVDRRQRIRAQQGASKLQLVEQGLGFLLVRGHRVRDLRR